MHTTSSRWGALLLCLALLLSVASCTSDQPDGLDTEPGESTSELVAETTSSDTESRSEETTASSDVSLPDLQITEDGGIATVRTSRDLTYTVQGYEAIDDNAFRFTSGLTLSLDPADFADSFNRFTLTYTASAPVKISVTYEERDSGAKTDSFFLEAGEGTFSCLVSEYLRRKSGTGIAEIVVDTCENKSADFTLYHLAAERIEVYTASRNDTTYYIQNDHLKLGIDMGWGGTVVYLADLTSEINGLENLVNKHDTGRLIQQSFYGTPPIPGVYETDIFNGSQWVYNPVQGGDQHNNSSRLIDVQVTETSIYIKAQPQDWSLDGVLTPSYMENTYILDGNCVRVDNRFVDFSGWEHPYSSQELPALYTVSYLDTFVWYDGSKDASADSCNYVAPINTVKMVSYVPMAYSYLLTTGTVEDIRATFAKRKDFSANDSLHENYLTSRIPDIQDDMTHIDFTDPNSAQLLLYGKTAEAVYNADAQATKLTVTGPDPFLYFDFALGNRELNASDYIQVVIEYMIPTTNSQSSYAAELFVCTGSVSEAVGGMSLNASLQTDGKYHAMTFNLGGQDFWNGKLNKFRFDFFNTASNAGDVMYIKSFKLIKGTYTPPSAPVYAHPNSLDFSNPHNLALFENLSDTKVAFDEAAGTAHLTSINGTDPNVTIRYANLAPVMQADDYTTLQITYMIPTTTTLAKAEMDLFFCAGDVTSPSGEMMLRLPLVADGQFHILTVNLSDKSYWSGQINAIRIDYFANSAPGEQMYIQSVELTN